jgi:hypothetical protein
MTDFFVTLTAPATAKAQSVTGDHLTAVVYGATDADALAKAQDYVAAVKAGVLKAKLADMDAALA